MNLSYIKGLALLALHFLIVNMAISNRRQFLQSALATSALACGGPWIHVRRKQKLRVLGTHVTLQEPIRKQAQAVGQAMEWQDRHRE